ncbi:MAG: SH3-like domain-containing protein [Mycobacteriales bacterium]
MPFSPGDHVLTRITDPTHHTRVPRYARGRIGTVVEREGTWALPDVNAYAPGAQVEAVYSVRFDARDLWGEGSHAVVLNLWESYLEAVG